MMTRNKNKQTNKQQQQQQQKKWTNNGIRCHGEHPAAIKHKRVCKLKLHASQRDAELTRHCGSLLSRPTVSATAMIKLLRTTLNSLTPFSLFLYWMHSFLTSLLW